VRILRAYAPRPGAHPLTGPIAGYFARSTPAAYCIPADQAELASGARRQRRWPGRTIDRMDDPGNVFQRNHNIRPADASLVSAHS
jgi:hypothetical protein